MLTAKYGIEHFEFVDDAFTANRRRLFELSDALRKIPRLTFSCVTRLENIDEETAPALRAAGMYRANIGVESANNDTISRIHKKINLDKLEPALHILRKNGIEASLFFMFGFPWESASDMRETNRMIERLRPLVRWYNEGGVLTPYPGTEIYERYRESEGFTDWWLGDWKSPGEEPLHLYQRRYFFHYDDEQIAAMREGLDIILEHNRGPEFRIEKLKHDLVNAAGKAEHLEKILAKLEVESREREKLLREMDDKIKEISDSSAAARLRRIIKSIKP